MDLHEELYSIAKLLLSENACENTAEILLQRALQTAGADRGFIVVRSGDGFEQRAQVRFARENIPTEARRFSRSLVRQAIETGLPVESANVLLDPRFAPLESVQQIGPRAVLATPLRQAGEIWGVVYLESAGKHPGFCNEARPFLTEFAEIAGLSLKKAVEHEELQRTRRSLERDLFARYRFEGIVTRDPKMLELLETVAQVADTDATVLILGETGTGKELLARALHWNSSKSKKPFVTLNCGAMPGQLLESELFGHVRGAFTGAERDRQGRIASAQGGTLFLDEVAEMPPEVQVKLLRFLQFGEVQRLGSDRVEKVETRVLAATHQDLPAQIQAGRFRQDLYFRLNVLELKIPPLRERKEDIPLLIQHFLDRRWRRRDEKPRFTGSAEQALLAHAWPGNIRELEHVVERACLLARGPELDLNLLPTEMSRLLAPPATDEFMELSNEALKAAKETAVSAVERRFLEALMRNSEGNVSKAARTSGIHRSHLQKLLAEHRIG